MTDSRSYPESIDGPEDIWEAYISETPAKQRSPQGAMAYAFGALTRASDSYFDMLWRWFTERRGADDMRANALDGGLSADDFKLMLDDHERNIMAPQPATDAQAAPVPADDTAVNCARFVRWALQDGPWDGGDLDGASVQDKAEALGLIVAVPYDPEKHGEDNNYGCDAGDPWFEFSPGLNALRTSPVTSTARASPCDGAEDLEHLDGMLDDRELGE